MYAYIRGKLQRCSPTTVIVEAGGIGYEIQIGLRTYAEIQHREEVLLWLYLYVKEDLMTLYGFATAEEKEIFQRLISVSGVGPNTARLILSSMSPEEIVQAVHAEDVQAFASVKGIGKKTAQKLIIDLRDKLGKTWEATSGMVGMTKQSAPYAEAALALQSLGFQPPAIRKALQVVQRELGTERTTEEVLRNALKLLATG